MNFVVVLLGDTARLPHTGCYDLRTWYFPFLLPKDSAKFEFKDKLTQLGSVSVKRRLQTAGHR